MTNRTLFIDSAKKIHSENGQIAILLPDGEEKTVPPEDVMLIMIDCATMISSSMIQLASHNNIPIVVCGTNHMPDFYGGPIETNSLQGERIRKQLDLPEDKRERLWQMLIRAKIRNQADLLDMLSIGGDTVREFAGRTEPGDPTNMEGAAAATYWKLLFGKNFRRDRYGDHPNPMLNYGYQVIRAVVAKALAGSGLLTQVGLHHHNRSDAHPLANDMMEPFRPIVDKAVFEMYSRGLKQTDKTVRKELVSLIYSEVLLAGQRHAVWDAAVNSATSLMNSLDDDVEQLLLPSLC